MHQHVLFKEQKLQKHVHGYLEFLCISATKNCDSFSVLIWTNGRINTEEYRILTWIHNFMNYDIIISDQNWCYNIIILSRNFYAFSLSLPKGDLELMHRILYVWIFEYRILTWTQNFVNYDIVISDQSWCYNIIILSRNFYTFSLSLPKGDLDLMHRILYVWILT